MDMEALIVQLRRLQETALAELTKISATKDLTNWRVQYLGKKSELNALSKQMGGLRQEERPLFGERVNEVRNALEAAYLERQTALAAAEQALRLAQETIDITLPGRAIGRGAIHPISRVIQEIEDIFLGMGFSIVDGPEIETDHYNFELLNLPKDHPARDMQDTFYLSDELLLRTHTSPMQVRTMERMQGDVPIKVIVPGRVYRRDEDDATHSHQFTQIEGLVVGEGIRMSDLKGTLESFAKALFGPEQRVRLRPSYFPFTEPSAEVDLLCVHCHGEGCRVCKGTGWIEILGAGMVHPRVLDMSGYDSTRYSGFAFGMGPERIAMLRYGISDIRLLYQNDLRFLAQFARA
ncbi:phenylalanine--tRNA ligase subunit alpha [Alicyclobacillus hesperidum]|uniref:Phenylalanine--tRNA ligase alpha subunit n=2 Tax=Alicyclobacillus hesperidum TaxID=89784 RepID=A0AA37X4L1_9BACL|nr:phenylalanine--tRNA ligase subunit alpha [Alicyclobacillus hesperidum]